MHAPTCFQNSQHRPTRPKIHLPPRQRLNFVPGVQGDRIAAADPARRAAVVILRSRMLLAAASSAIHRQSRYARVPRIN